MGIDINFTSASSYERNAANSVEVLTPNVVKQGDTKNELRVKLMSDGAPVDLTSATVLWSAASSKGAVIVDRAATVHGNGEVSVKFEDDDIGIQGTIRIEFRVTYATGAVEKFPANDHVRLEVTRSLDDMTHTPVLFASISYFNEKVAEASAAAKEASEHALLVEGQGQEAEARGVFAKEQGDFAKSQGEFAEQVAGENKTQFLPAVSTVEDRDAAYPNPANGDTVRVTTDAITYRFSNGSWVDTDHYNPTAIDGVTAQLAETAGNLKIVDDRVKGIDRGYGGTYATLTELQTSFPNGDDKRYVVAEDGNWYYWNESAWVAGGVFQSLGIADNSISAEKTDFISLNKSDNLYDENDSGNVEGVYLVAATNDFASHSSYEVSHYIPVISGETITYPVYATFGGAKNRIPIYDENENYLGYNSGTLSADDKFNTVTIDEVGAAYVRVNVLTVSSSDITKSTFMVVKGEVYPEEYTPYFHSFKLLESYYDESVINNLIQRETVTKFLDGTSGGDSQSMESNPLYGKIASFDGDSICHGGSAGDDLSGWAGRIGTKNNMIWENEAVGGGTITAETYSGETPKHWISRNVENLRSDADYIILEGGVNDADVVPEEKIGVISPGFTSSLDDTTLCGAVESLFKQAIIKYPDKKIGFIVAHKMAGETSKRREVFDLIIEICKKWGIPYIDLWRTAHLNRYIPEIESLMYTDGQHLSTQGYDFITPKIESWMKTL